MLEKIKNFFDKRAKIYDKHQFKKIEGARDFYLFAVNELPANPNDYILDIGCGTGIELELYNYRNENVRIDAIDISREMLKKADEKLISYKCRYFWGDFFYFDYPENTYTAAISIEAMHHYPQEKKIELYKKIYRSLTNDGYFILVDYFAKDKQEETKLFNELNRLIKEQNLDPNETYHFDIPFTLEHETYCLEQAGFKVLNLASWGSTSCLKCIKNNK